MIALNSNMPREFLNSALYGDKPLKQTVHFATHLFSPWQITSHIVSRQVDYMTILSDIQNESNIRHDGRDALEL